MDHVESQNKRILRYLLSGKSITSITALKMFDCFRLSARIYYLRKLGYPIKTTNITLPNGKTVASYSI